MKKTYTVSEITGYIKKIITTDMILSSIYVTGEISNLKLHTSSHIYFTLKDDNASIRAVMFSNYTKLLRFVPKDGMKVIIYGYVTVYERAGQYQLTVSNIIPEGYGELYLAFEQLKEKLRLKGYFYDDKKKKIPVFPERVAIITSKTGAALKDFLNVAARRAKGIPIHVYNSLVQGENASKQIVSRIKEINDENNVDVIVLSRGGGSIEDLWAFNEEIVAKAIFDSVIPIVTGIGHETDFTIADMVADLRAPTPSAAAEIVFPEMLNAALNISNMNEKIKMIISSRIQNAYSKLGSVQNVSVIKKPEILFERYKMDVDIIVERINSLIEVKFRFVQQGVENMITLISKINPINILKKGFNYTKNSDDMHVTSAKDVRIGETITVEFYDGDIKANVKDVMIYERDQI